MRILLAFLLLCSISQAGVREALVKVRVPTGDGTENTGTGTLVGQDGGVLYGITCAHAFEPSQARGTTFRIDAYDGFGTRAVLEDINRLDDVALFSCAPREGVDTIPLAEEEPHGEWTLLGFPGGGALRVAHGQPSGRDITDTQGKPLYDFSLDVAMPGGVSGGPMLCGGLLCGVISAGKDNFNLCGCTQRTLKQFASKRRTICENGRCRLLDLFPRRRQPQQAQPARPVLGTPQTQPTAGPGLADLTKLRGDIVGDIKALLDGQAPAPLQLPLDPSALKSDIAAEVQKIVQANGSKVTGDLLQKLEQTNQGVAGILPSLDGALKDVGPAVAKQVGADLLPAITSALPGIGTVLAGVGGPVGLALGVVGFLLRGAINKNRPPSPSPSPSQGPSHSAPQPAPAPVAAQPSQPAAQQNSLPSTQLQIQQVPVADPWGEALQEAMRREIPLNSAFAPVVERVMATARTLLEAQKIPAPTAPFPVT